MKWTEPSKIFALSVIFICLPLFGMGFWYMIGVNPFKPITINGDKELAKYSSRGTGTTDDPYIVEGINHKKMLIIKNTESYFILQYCKIQTTGDGIRLAYIRNNTATLRYNTLINCSILLYSSDGVDVINNSFSGLGGLQIGASSFLSIYNNSFENYGISFVDEYYGPGYFSDYVPFVFDYANNTIADLEIEFFFNYSNSIINEQYGQIFLLKCSNITIQNQQIRNAKIGIFVYRTNSCVISNCEFDNCYYGIYAQYVVGFDFYNNTFCYELYSSSSLIIFECSSGTISNNSFIGADNFMGIRLYNSKNFTISRNFLQGCTQGLFFEYCESILIWKNHIEHTFYQAVFVMDSTSLIFYQNNFILSDITDDELSQASEHSCTSILWYNVTLSIGNYWNTWSGTGWYKIATSTDNYDKFPLTNPVDIYS